jgi:elongator complex protein 2
MTKASNAQNKRSIACKTEQGSDIQYLQPVPKILITLSIHFYHLRLVTMADPVHLLHHGAAANSSNNIVCWLEPQSVVYASHSNISIARRVPRIVNDKTEFLWSIRETLRCQHDVSSVITCLAVIQSSTRTIIVSGSSDGLIVLWLHLKGGKQWKECSVDIDSQEKRSVTVMDGLWLDDTHILLLYGSSDGVSICTCHVDLNDDKCTVVSLRVLLPTAVSSVKLIHHKAASQILIMAGTSSPRHNEIHIWHQQFENDSAPVYSGSLVGHEDWISCLSWKEQPNGSCILASGSQDSKIRLWNFTSRAASDSTGGDYITGNDDLFEELDVDGESRLEIVGHNKVTSVTLEALLLGHEASVTSVCFHPNPEPIYRQDLMLISSSTDRSIFLWAASEDGIWAPLTRVGNAGGILGGPVGSSLLGYCKAVIEPEEGRVLVGHAYGGALHAWELDNTYSSPKSDELKKISLEVRASLVKWSSTPTLTGHFSGVKDLSWEATRGDYLLTVSDDQTCRMWTQVGASSEIQDKRVWCELGRPQVHGYELAAVVSVSQSDRPHTIITGADEKELRVFDAPLATLRLLKAIAGVDAIFFNDQVKRVERAYIPSLGLTNKASAADGADEDDAEINESDLLEIEAKSLEKIRFPLERDLGVTSIWPESLKLFGHSTELYCLTATVSARTSGHAYVVQNHSSFNDSLIASSAKARDVKDASIRVWDLEQGKCVQILEGGHKSTVATLSFSPNGEFLASAGKDRRLCIWKRDVVTRQFTLAWAKDVAHKRIIWSVHFCPFDETLLSSGSRDGCVKLWRIQTTGDLFEAVELCSFAPLYKRDGKPDAVTALSFSPRPVNSKKSDVILAVGLESGRIELWIISTDPISCELFHQVSYQLCHCATVRKLAWKPSDDASSTNEFVLASCSMDHGCRIYSVTVP